MIHLTKMIHLKDTEINEAYKFNNEILIELFVELAV